MDSIDEVLEHYGIRGMHWGVRTKSDGPSPPGMHKEVVVVKTSSAKDVLRTITAPRHTTPDAIKTHNSAVKIKKYGLKAVTNQELKDLNYRINLEQNFRKMVPKEMGRIKRGRDTMERMVWKAGEEKLQPYIHMYAGKGLTKVLGAAVP